MVCPGFVFFRPRPVAIDFHGTPFLVVDFQGACPPPLPISGEQKEGHHWRLQVWDKDREAPTPQKERHPPKMYVASSDFCTSPRKAERSLHRPFLTTLVWSAETRKQESTFKVSQQNGEMDERQPLNH